MAWRVDRCCEHEAWEEPRKQWTVSYREAQKSQSDVSADVDFRLECVVDVDIAKRNVTSRVALISFDISRGEEVCGRVGGGREGGQTHWRCAEIFVERLV